MGLKKIERAGTLALPLASLKPHVRITPEDTLHDQELRELIEAAVDHVEHYTRRALLQAKWTQTWHCWSDCLILMRSRLVAITHLKYYDSDNALQTVSADDYRADTFGSPPKVTFAPTFTRPQLAKRNDAIQLTYEASSVEGTPATLSHGLSIALKQLVAHWFDGPKGGIDSRAFRDIPWGVKNILQGYVVPELW